MEPFPFLDKPFPQEPAWPEEPGPYLFLLEESGPAERMMLQSWIQRNRPESVSEGDVQIAVLPQTRRRRRKRRIDPRLEAFLAAGDDPLLVPLRVAWFPTERDGERVVGLLDTLIPGDPRDPDPIRQFAIAWTRPDRTRIIEGEQARASWVRKMWAEPGGRGQEEGYSLAEFAAQHAWVRLERAEREIRGNRYKVPKFVHETLVESRPFTQGVAQLARGAGTTYEQMANRTQRYVREIAATHSPYVIDLVMGGFHWLIGKAYVDIVYDKDELDALYTLGQHYPLVFLPSHKSHFDHMILMHALYENGLPPNHTAGGINLNFFPIGPFLRRSGVFFIRREFKDNEPYKFVLRRYIDYLLEKRFPIEWFIEGGRSRTGKLRPPRLGMLAYIVESYERGASDDVIIIPVAIAYDQISEVSSYTAEQTGEKKERESLGWLVRTVRSLRLRYGSSHLRFGAPISTKTFLSAEALPHVDADDARNPSIPKLAFEIAGRINEATPITPITLVTIALLSAGDRALTLDEVVEALRPFAEDVAARSLPTTQEIDPDDRAKVVQALDELTVHGVVSRFEGATDTVYRVQPEQYLAAAYYRNTIIHFFLTDAITELSLLHIAETHPKKPARALIEDALRIRDDLKFDFFFSPSEVFAEEVRDILRRRDPDFRDHLKAGGAVDLLAQSRPFRAPAVLRPFFEAYRVVGDLIEQHAYESTIDADHLAKDAIALGKQYQLQGRIRSPESVSAELFGAAIKLAENRNLLEPHPDMVERRLEFARSLRDMIHRIEILETIDAARDIGVLEALGGQARPH